MMRGGGGDRNKTIDLSTIENFAGSPVLLHENQDSGEDNEIESLLYQLNEPDRLNRLIAGL